MLMDIDVVGAMLEQKGLSHAEIDTYFEHQGVKGMKWGVRRDRTNSSSDSSSGSKRDAKKEVVALSKNAREIIRESRRAGTASERKRAANRYEKEVLNKVKTPEFKAAYKKATHIGKGEMAVNAILSGPFAPLTISLMRKSNKSSDAGYEFEVDMAHEILREMRMP